jgi:hypothetical protein
MNTGSSSHRAQETSCEQPGREDPRRFPDRSVQAPPFEKAVESYVPRGWRAGRTGARGNASGKSGHDQEAER